MCMLSQSVIYKYYAIFSTISRKSTWTIPIWQIFGIIETTFPSKEFKKFSRIKLFGQEVNLFKLGRMPAQVIVDKKSIARFVHYGHAMSDIPDNEEIISFLNQINEEVI